MGLTFGDFLKQKRLEKNLTQKQLANILFMSESAVSKWEKGVSHPDITMLPKLSEVLSVSEHELITASIDNQSRKEKNQAKKWCALVVTWELFFYINYAIAILTCFICNLAVSGTLSWFWIVLSALLLSFTLINLPKFIKKHKLLLIPLFDYVSLIILLAVCAIYTAGDWFFVASVSVLLGLTMIFMPIFIAKFSVFNRIKKYNDFVSFFIDFVVLNVLLLVIESYTLMHGVNAWYLKTALPIAVVVYLALNVVVSLRFLRTNKLLKTGLMLLLTKIFIFSPPLFIKVSNPALQKELDDLNVFMANLSVWNESTIDNNVFLIILLVMVALTTIFTAIGLIKHFRKK
ncbi:MAG: helix-turn-helix transcriptional regulator [Clostridia bacterium]|nr:helix-turn-helix transcriptional regulator [Clostridia bacterium]